jgi:TPR repeat protein
LAQFNLGTMYERGLGVKQDYVEALRWYREAAKQNQAGAQNNIGDFYETGRGGVTQDFVQAAEWYLKAAEKGVSAAQNSLGQFYRDGQGVPKNLREAENWFRLAADQGHESAKKNLSALLAGGAAPQ